MNKKIYAAVAIFVMASFPITVFITRGIFNSSFARATVDYFSFGAALFLIIDGLYKINRYKNEPYLPNNIIRHIRIIIGTSIFTIHVLQYVYGL